MITFDYLFSCLVDARSLGIVVYLVSLYSEYLRVFVMVLYFLPYKLYDKKGPTSLLFMEFSAPPYLLVRHAPQILGTKVVLLYHTLLFYYTRAGLPIVSLMWAQTITPSLFSLNSLIYLSKSSTDPHSYSDQCFTFILLFVRDERDMIYYN